MKACSWMRQSRCIYLFSFSSVFLGSLVVRRRGRRRILAFKGSSWSFGYCRSFLPRVRQLTQPAGLTSVRIGCLSVGMEQASHIVWVLRAYPTYPTIPLRLFWFGLKRTTNEGSMNCRRQRHLQAGGGDATPVLFWNTLPSGEQTPRHLSSNIILHYQKLFKNMSSQKQPTSIN